MKCLCILQVPADRSGIHIFKVDPLLPAANVLQVGREQGKQPHPPPALLPSAPLPSLFSPDICSWSRPAVALMTEAVRAEAGHARQVASHKISPFGR